MAANENISSREKLCTILLVIGILLGVTSLWVQGDIAKRSRLDDDFDHEFVSTGTSTYIDKEYIYPYHPMGIVTGQANDSYTTEKTTTIMALGENSRYVTYSYQTSVEQDSFMVDMNGAMPGGIMMMGDVIPNTPPNIAFNFTIHRNTETIMFLEKSNYNYYTPAYETQGEIPKTGYARSVFTRNLEEESYPIWIGSIGEAVDAKYLGEETVKGIDGYKYEYSYEFRMKLSKEGEPLMELVLTETTAEVHQKDLGMLLALETNISYSIEGQVLLKPVLLYSEESSFEIDQEDSDDIDTAVSMVASFHLISNILGLLAIPLLLGGVFGYKD